MKTLIIISLLIIPVTLLSQDIKTTNLAWSVSGLNDLRTSKSENYACTFETRGAGDILWKQRGGSYLTTLRVSSVDGDWTDVKNPGQVVYRISVDGQTGTLTFERNDSGLFVTLDLSQSRSERMRHRLSVGQVSVLN